MGLLSGGAALARDGPGSRRQHAHTPTANPINTPSPIPCPQPPVQVAGAECVARPARAARVSRSGSARTGHEHRYRTAAAAACQSRLDHCMVLRPSGRKDVMAAMAAVRWSLRVASRQAARALLAAGRRVRWRLPGCLLGCLALGITASALIGQTRHSAQLPAERTTSALPVPVLVDAGPPPGPLLPLWQVTTGNVADLAIQGGQIGHGLVDGQLVVVSGAGIDVRDARTGSPRWHYYRKGWMLVGWAATRTEIAAFFQRVAQPLAHILAVLDAPTGRTLWQSARDRPVGIGPSSLRWLSGPEAFLVSRDGRVIRGVASRDGWTLWSRQLPSGCAVSASGAYGSDGDDTDVDVFSVVCGSSQRLVAVNPVDGNIRWRERSGTGAAAAVTVQHGITSVWDGDALQVLSSTG